MPHLIIGADPLTLGQLLSVFTEKTTLALDPSAEAALARSAATVSAILAEGKTVYGINTGFGILASQRIASEQLRDLQRNLVLSHSTGVGNLLDDDTVRLIMVLKVAGLARGNSGIRPLVVEALIRLIAHEIYPCIPEKGSVGASGDLAPLAHLAAAMIGEGSVRARGRVMPATEGLALAGMKPLILEAKEGLALLNGTQVSTALALRGFFAAENVFAAASVAGAMSVDAALGSDTPFDPRIHAVRGQPGQIAAAGLYRELLAGSEIRHSHLECDRVQDPYSLRCQPQVMGACLDLIRFAAGTLEIEANAVTDNPLIFPETAEALSGGNFHAEPIAMAADILALAIAEIGSISERRISLLIDPSLSQLPAFLVAESGVNSGFMIAQVTAAALASENKSLAHPASVDSLPTSANQEDHVSMATFAARRLKDMAENTANIVAIELLAAAQGIDFRAPLRTSPILQGVLAAIRAQVPAYTTDRFFAPDIDCIRAMVLGGSLRTHAASVLP